MPDEEARNGTSPESPTPNPPNGEGAPPTAPGAETVNIPPVAKVFMCRICRRGKLDPKGLRIGDWMSCPDCGARAQVTLEHTMGEERASRREKARKTFLDMTDEEKAEFLANKSFIEKVIIFFRYRLGPKGTVALYLGVLVLVVVGAVIIAVASGKYRLESIAWWKVVLWIVGGAFAGLAGHFIYVTVMYHYRKSMAGQDGSLSSRRGSRRTSARGRTSSSRGNGSNSARQKNGQQSGG